MADYYVLANAIVITAGVNDVIRIEEDTAGAPGSSDVDLTAGTYYLFGDGSEATDFCTMLETRLTADSPNGNTYTCSFAAKVDPTSGAVTGTLTINPDTYTVKILGSHANNTFNLNWIGFADGADSSAADPLTSTLSPAKTWCSNQPAQLLYPSSVQGGSAQHRTQEGQRHTFRSSDAVQHRRMAFSHVDDERTWGATADQYKGFDEFWDQMVSGQPTRLYKDSISSGTTLNTLSSADLVGTYVLSAPLDRWEPTADSSIPSFSWEIELATYVS